MASIFDKIISKELEAHIIYEDDMVLAFLDLHPRAPAHTLVIPKQAVASLPELDDEYIAPLFKAVKRIMKAIQSSLHPDGFTVGINQGRYAGQAVDHLHVHILPRYKGDGAKSIHSVVDNASDRDLALIREDLLKALA